MKKMLVKTISKKKSELSEILNRRYQVWSQIVSANLKIANKINEY